MTVRRAWDDSDGREWVDPFHHAAGIRAYSAQRKRWPVVTEIRSRTPEGLARWWKVDGTFRTARAAARRGRELRDQHGARYEPEPGALVYGYRRESDGWHVYATRYTRKPKEVPF